MTPPIELGPDADPAEAKQQERNWFFHSLAPEAKERFLEALEVCAERGLDEDTAWREAVIAAETSYPDRVPERREWERRRL